MGERSGLPVALQDERLTSVQAQRTLVAVRPGRAKKKRGPEDVDQVAAILILQTWLDRRSAHRSDGGEP
jgi:putative Holliday junction resolvase